MFKKIARYMQEWKMLEQNDKVIAGISGGADSVCLLFVLMEMQKDIPFQMVVVHVNHGLRGKAADADENYVRQLCEKYCIPFECYRENVELIAKNRKQSTEEAGRDIRREAFERTAALYGGTKIALAHHKNDNVETMLMNLARGTGLKGLGGMAPVNGNIIRPLLCVERREIEQYLDEQRIPYCIDLTNQTDDYTRNRIRNHVIPYLKNEVNAGVVSHVDKAMQSLREIQEFVQSQTAYYYEKCVISDKRKYVIDEKEYREIPNAIQNLVLKKVLTDIVGREKDLESVHLRILKELMEKQVGRKVNLPYGIVAKRSYQGLVIFHQENLNQGGKDEQIISFEIGKEQAFYWGNKVVRCRVFEKTADDMWYPQKNNTKWFDYDIINRTVSFRTRRPGDYITIHQTGGTQKLKSYFVNEKIPQEERDGILLVAEGSHVMWVLGHRMSSAYQISKNTKHILEISIDEGEEYEREN